MTPRPFPEPLLEGVNDADREMISAILDAHYERWGSALKGPLFQMMFLGGKRAGLEELRAQLDRELP